MLTGAFVLLASVGAAPPEPSAHGISLQIGFDARSQVEAAERLLEQGRWESALPMLQELLDHSPRALLWDGRAYVPLRRLLNRRIAGLPEGAIQTYRLLYEPQARRLYQKAVREPSEPALRSVARRFANTRHGSRAIVALAALLMDGGRWGPALLALRRLSTDLAPPEVRRAAAARRLICLVRLGRWRQAERLAAELEKTGLGKLRIGGSEFGARAYLERLWEQVAPPPEPARGGRWPTLGGSAGGRPSRALYSPHRLAPLPLEISPAAEVRADWPSLSSVRTVANEETLFLNVSGSLVALDRRTCLARWRVPPGGSAPAALAERFGSSFLLPPYLPILGLHHWRTFDNHGQATLSLAEGRLYAVRMNPRELEFPPEPWKPQPGETRLVNQVRCYDSASGELLWNARRGWFFTAPTVADGRAHVLVAESGILYAACLDAGTGRLLWRRPIGPFRSREQAQSFAMELFLADAGPPSVRNGVAVYPTGQGVVCAFEADSGALRWIAPYPRASRRMEMLTRSLQVPTSGWAPSQPVLAGRLCLLTPTDSKHLVALRLADGSTAWKRDFEAGTVLLGVADRHAYVQQGGAVTCLEVGSGEPVWAATVKGPVVGVGALGSSRIYLPRRDGVLTLALEDGTEGPFLRWPPGMTNEGNLLLLDDCLVSSSPNRVLLSRRLEPTEKALKTARRAQASPRPSLLLALLKAYAGEVPAAVALLEQALDSGPEGDHRERERAVLAAAVLANLPSGEGAGRLLERVRRQLPPEWPVALELDRTRLRWALRDDAAASIYLRLCGQRGMLPYPGTASIRSRWTELASTVREKCAGSAAIRERWRRSAANLLERAAERGDGETLGDLAAWGPFRGERAGALLAMARLLRQSGRTAAARRALAQLLQERPPEPEAEEARRMLQQLPALVRPRPVRGYARAGALPELPTDADPVPLWTAPGSLVPPHRGAGAALVGKVLVLAESSLQCLEAASGDVLWELPLGRAAREVHWPGPASPGYPFHSDASWGTLVGLPTVLHWIDSGTGRLLRSKQTGREMPGTHRHRISRIDLIQRASRGLPVRSEDPAFYRARPPGLLLSPVAACRLYARGGVWAGDPATGEELFQHTPARHTHRRGVVGAVSGRACLARQGPAVLILREGWNGELLGRWRLRYSRFVGELAITPRQRVVLAGRRALFVVDLREPGPARRLPVPFGVETLIYADDSAAVIATRSGRAALVPLDGRPPVRLSAPGHPLWARHVGEALHLLTAGELESTRPYGPRVHWKGKDVALHAVATAGSALRWTRSLGGEEMLVSPPLVTRRYLLVGKSTPDGMQVLGIGRSSGDLRFETTLPNVAGDPPVLYLVDKWLVAGGRKNVGVLAPGGTGD